MSEDEKKTEELYEMVRCVLNKLTSHKFNTLVHQLRSLTIDTKERLEGVVDLVYEKVVDEPHFSEAYASLCKELALVEVPADITRKDGDSVNFRKLLVTRCQLDFEKHSVDQTVRNVKLKEIEECADPETKRKLQLLLKNDDRRIQRKAVGRIRFIGELFKQNMLTVTVMMRCLHHLLEKKDEESLECLSELLYIVGKEVEKRMDLNTIFSVIKEIVDKKHGEISSRVRLKLQDVIDLRNSKWVYRGQNINLRTIDEIPGVSDQLTTQIQGQQLVVRPQSAPFMQPVAQVQPIYCMPYYGSSTGQRPVILPPYISGKTFTARSCPQTPQQTQTYLNYPQYLPQGVQPHVIASTPQKLQQVAPQKPPKRRRAKAIPVIDPESGKDKLDNDEIIINDWHPAPVESSAGQTPQNDNSQFRGRKSRTDFQHRPHDSQQSKPMQTNQPNNNPSATTKPRQQPVEQMSPELIKEMECKIKNTLEDPSKYYSVHECDDDIGTSLPPVTLSKLVSESFICVLDRSKIARLETGSLFANLLKRSTLSVDDYCFGLEEILSQADNLTIDIPNIWDYLAEIIAPIINENAVPLQRLHQSFNVLIEHGHASKLLDPLFKLVITEKGPNYLHNQWKESNLNFSDFMKSSEVNNFILKNQFEFLLGKSNTVVSQSELTYEQIHKKLSEFFANDNCLEDIFLWIETTVGERVHEKLFIRSLATAIFEYSIVKSKLKFENLRKYYSLLIRFIDGHLDYELECLYALQALINKLEHPQETMLSIFRCLYDDSLFSHDSFIKWKISDNPAEQDGKGVALKQLTSFFMELKEVDEETSSIEDA